MEAYIGRFEQSLRQQYAGHVAQVLALAAQERALPDLEAQERPQPLLLVAAPAQVVGERSLAPAHEFSLGDRLGRVEDTGRPRSRARSVTARTKP